MTMGRNALSSKSAFGAGCLTMLAGSHDLNTHHQHCCQLRPVLGFTFPGMMDDPGSFVGRTSSINPERGPEPSHRRSFATLKSATAAPFRALCALTMRSDVACAVNGLGAGSIPNPVRSANTRRDISRKPRRSIDACANSGSAHRHRQQPSRGLLNVGNRIVHSAPDVPRPFLPNRERSRILQVESYPPSRCLPKPWPLSPMRLASHVTPGGPVETTIPYPAICIAVGNGAHHCSIGSC